jgi:hypothetical protein
MTSLLEQQQAAIKSLAAHYRPRMGTPWAFAAELKANFCTDTECCKQVYGVLISQINFKMPKEQITTPAIFQEPII